MKGGRKQWRPETELGRRRQMAGLSQTEIAEVIGVSQVYYGNIERGLLNPSHEVAQKIADMYDVPLDDLFDSETVCRTSILGVKR